MDQVAPQPATSVHQDLTQDLGRQSALTAVQDCMHMAQCLDMLQLNAKTVRPVSFRIRMLLRIVLSAQLDPTVANTACQLA